MSYQFDSKLARNSAELAYHLFRHAIDNCGWTSYYAGGGTGSGVSGAGLDPFTTRDSWLDDNSAHMSVKEPAPGHRILTFQRGTNTTQMGVWVGYDPATPSVPTGDEDTRPTLPEEQQIVGTGGSVKSSFVDTSTTFQVFLFGDDEAGGDYTDGVDDGTRHVPAAHLLGFVAKPMDRSNSTGDRMFGMFPMTVFPGSDDDPVVYMEAWTGQSNASADFLGWHLRNDGSEAFQGTNQLKPYYWRESGGEQVPGVNTGPVHLAGLGKTTRAPILVGKGQAAPKYLKGVLQDVFWALQDGGSASAGYGSSITVGSFVKGSMAARTDQDFIRICDDIFIPWDLSLFPLQV